MAPAFRVIVTLRCFSFFLLCALAAPADAREEPMARYGCHRHHFHHHKHAGYHCSTGPLAGQDFDSKGDLVKALKAQGIDPAKDAAPKTAKPAAAAQ